MSTRVLTDIRNRISSGPYQEPAIKKPFRKGVPSLHTACYSLRAEHSQNPMCASVGVGQQDGKDVLVFHERHMVAPVWRCRAAPKSYMGFSVVVWAAKAPTSGVYAFQVLP